MKISNFRDMRRNGNSILNYQYRALVDIETGFLFWKKKATVGVAKEYAGFWYFFENGEFLISNSVENLSRSYLLKNGLRQDQKNWPT